MARGLRQTANEPELEFVPEQEQEVDFVPLSQEEAGNLTKAEYLASGGRPEDVISPEREAVLQQETQRQLQAGATPQQAAIEAGKAVDAIGTIRRPDGTIAEGYKPTEQALAEGIIEKPAIPAVKEAQRLGIETVSSGTDKNTGIGFAIGRNKAGKVVRLEAGTDGVVDVLEMEPEEPSRLGAVTRTLASQLIPTTTGAVAAETAAALTPGGILPKLAVGALAGVGGFIAGQKGQEAAGKALLGPERMARISEVLQRDVEKYPVSTTAASILTPTAGGLTALARSARGIFPRQAAPVAEAVAPKVAEVPSAVVPKAEQAVAKVAEPTAAQILAQRVAGPGEKVSKLPTRIIKGKLAKEETLREIAKGDIFYKTKSVNEIEDGIQGLSNDDVAMLANRDDIVGDVAKVSMFKRFSESGDPVKANGYLELLRKPGTDFGQRLNVFKLIKMEPAVYAQGVSKIVEQSGYRIGDDLLKKITELKKQANTFQNQFNIFSQKARDSLDDVDITKAINKEKELTKALFNLQAVENRLVPKRLLGELLPTLIQGNLLTPISLVTNLWSNAVNAPLRMASRQGAFLAQEIGRAFQKVAGQELGPRLIAPPTGGIRRTIEVGKAGLRGLEEGLVGVRRGMSAEGLLAGERIQGLKPLVAFKQFWTGQGLAKPVQAGFRGMTQQVVDRARLAAEALLGVPPETMLRLLQLGDAPFRRMAQARLLTEQAQLAGKTGKALQVAVRLPTKGQVAKIEQEAAEAVFQQDTPLSRAALNAANLFGLGSKYGVARLFAKTIIPYAKTPANVIDELVEFALPPYALTKMAIAARNKDYRQAQMSFGKFITGSTVGGVTAFLLDNNIIGEKPSVSEKIRDIQYKTVPPRTINITALNRLAAGESTDVQPGDKIISLEKLGIVGGIMSTWDAAAKGKQGERGVNIDAVLPETLSFAFNQSFLKGTNSLLSAMLDGSGATLDKWISDYYGVVSSIALPNTLSAVSRSMREALPDKLQIKDIEEGEFLERPINVFAEVIKRKLPGADEDLPRRIDIWGREVPQTPEGADPVLYNFVDVTKGREVAYDPVTISIYKIFKATEDGDVIPPKPLRNFTIKNTSYRLSPELYETYSKMRGKANRQVAEQLLRDSTFKKMSNDEKVIVLRRGYAQVGDDVRKDFANRYERRIKAGAVQ
jgi:hypothetical protein